MERVGVRELRQHASELLRRVGAGERIEVTNRGRVVAILAPPPEGDLVTRLRRAGRLKPATHTGPLPARRRTAASVSAALAEQRADER